MITTVPPRSLTEHVNVQKKKKKKTFLTNDRRVIQPTCDRLTEATKPQACLLLREGYNLIREQSGHIHRHQQSRAKCPSASESYTVGENLNSGKGTWPEMMCKGIELTSEWKKPNLKTMYQCSVYLLWVASQLSLKITFNNLESRMFTEKLHRTQVRLIKMHSFNLKTHSIHSTACME